MNNKIIAFVFVFLLALLIIHSVNAESINDPDGYSITEETDYSIGTNTVYITIEDNTNSKKDVNVTFSYKEGDKTIQLNHKEMNMKANVTKLIYGIVNNSLGKYSNNNTIIENNTDYYEYEDSNNNRLCLENVDTGNLTGCDYILDDKSVLKEEREQVDTKEVPEWIDLSSNQDIEKENTADKIQFKNNYLPLGKVKDSNKVELKLEVEHPIFTENYQVPDDQNKYNITVTSSDGKYKTVLDPIWWNESYDYRYKHEDNGSNYKGVGWFGANSTLLGTNGWYGLLGNNAYTYEDSENNNFAIANETHELCWYNSSSDVGFSGNCEEGLISHYTLDRSSGDVQDWISGNDGTNNGATRGVSGQVGNAFDFNDANNEYVKLSDNQFGGSSGFTMSMWLYFETSGNIQRFVSNDGNKPLTAFEQGDTFRANFIDENGENFVHDAFTINYGNWNHIVMTYDNGNTKVYKDGTEVSSDSSLSGNIDTGNLNLGDPTNTYNIDGKIDDVRIYDRALSSTEVSQLYSSQSTNKPYLGTQEVNSFLNLEDDFSDSVDYAINYTYQVDYNSSSDISEFNINDSRFNINNTGYLYMNQYLDSNNYSLYINATNTEGNTDDLYIDLEVKRIPITITADNRSKVYGDPDPSLTYSLNDTLRLDDSIIGSLSRIEGEDVGDYDILQDNLTIDDEQNYNINYISGILTINQKYLEIQIDDKEKEYNTADPNFTYSILTGSLQFNDTINEDYTREEGESVGNYSIATGFNWAINDGNNGQNYNEDITAGTLTIYENDDNCSLYFTEESPVEYNTTFRVYTDCSTNFTLYRDNTTIINNSEQDLAVGLYNYTVIRDDTENYTNYRDEELFNVTKINTSLGIEISPREEEYYNNDFIEIKGINCSSSINCSLYVNNNSVPNPYSQEFATGTYNIEYNTSGNENYSSDSVTTTLEVKETSINIFTMDFSKTSNIVILVILFILPFVLIYFFNYYIMASLITIVLGFLLIVNNFNIIVGIIVVSVGIYIAFVDSDNIKNKIIQLESE